MTLDFYYSGTRDLFGSLSLSSSVLALVAISGPALECQVCQNDSSLASVVIGGGGDCVAGLCRCHSDKHDELCPGNRCTSQISLIFVRVPDILSTEDS